MTFEFDIGQLPENYDKKVNQDFAVIPTSRADIEVLQVEGSKTKNNHIMISFEFSILNGDFKGEKVKGSMVYMMYGTIVVTEYFATFINSVRLALGMAEFPKFANSTQLVNFFKGKRFNVKIEQEEYVNTETGRQGIYSKVNLFKEIKSLTGNFEILNEKPISNAKTQNPVHVAQAPIAPVNVSSPPPHVWQQTQNPVHVAQAPINQGWQPNQPTTAQVLDDDIPF